ncbi:MAG: hypothetical protein JOZ54_03100 [Acidobacteria bacterium]|nr:hypothetical protein [Acidobacteriota bacterium]
METTTCGAMHQAKAYLVANDCMLSTAGGQLLDRILANASRFTLEDVAGSDADLMVRESALCLLEFLCEIGILEERDGRFVRASLDARAGTVSCVVCRSEWPVGPGALTAFPRSICLAPSFLVVMQSLTVVGICPACRVI